MNKVFNVGLVGCGHISETYFRAQEFFNTDEWKKYDKVVVLWGITSTARGEL